MKVFACFLPSCVISVIFVSCFYHIFHSILEFLSLFLLSLLLTLNISHMLLFFLSLTLSRYMFGGKNLFYTNYLKISWVFNERVIFFGAAFTSKTAQKMNSCRFLWMSYLQKKFLMENFIFCAMNFPKLNILLYERNLLIYQRNVSFHRRNVLFYWRNVLLYWRNVLFYRRNILLYRSNVFLFQRNI